MSLLLLSGGAVPSAPPPIRGRGLNRLLLLSGGSTDVFVAPVVIFTDQLATFLSVRLGVYAYPNKLPSRQANYPLVTYTVVTGDNYLLLSGASSLATITIQIDIWSPVSMDAETLSERLRKLLQDYAGMIGLVQVANVQASRPRSGYTPSAVGSDVGIYRASRDYEFQFYQ